MICVIAARPVACFSFQLVASIDMRLGNHHVCFSHKNIKQKKKRNGQNAQTAYRNLLPNALGSSSYTIQKHNTSTLLYTLTSTSSAHGKRKRGGVNALIRTEMFAQIALYGPP